MNKFLSDIRLLFFLAFASILFWQPAFAYTQAQGTASQEGAVLNIRDRGDTLPLQTVVDSAYSVLQEYGEKASKGEESAMLRKKARAHMRLGQIYYRDGLYTNSFNSYVEAMRMAEDNGFSDLLASIYSNIGKIYCTWSDYHTGLKYFLQGLAYTSPEKDADTYRSLLINLQGAYINIGDMRNAGLYYDKMCAMPRQDDITAYFKDQNKGLFMLDEKDPAGAVDYFRKAAATAISCGLDHSMLCSAYDYSGDALVDTRPDSATFYWEKALGLANIPPFMRLGLLKKLSDTFKRLKVRDKAVRYGNLYIMLSDSLFKMSEINRIRDMHTAYENEKKLRRIESLSLEKKEQFEKISRQKRVLAIAFAVIAIVVAMAVVLVSQKRKLKQTYLHLFHSYREMEKAQRLSEEREQALCAELDSLRAKLPSPQQEETPREVKPIEKTEKAPSEEKAEEKAHPEKEGKVQSVDRLTEEKRKEILAAVEKALGKEELICNPDFSINALADVTGYNSRYLSQVINDEYGCNFRTKVNEHRMIIAKRRILDVEKYGNYTIQAIADSVGFRSQSGFVQVFKKVTGFTPSMFQKMALSNE